MTGELMIQWAKHCLVPRLPSSRSPGVLLLDEAKAHRCQPFIRYLTDKCNITPVFIPAKTTSMLQPLDVGIFSPFKASLRRSWLEWQQQSENVQYTRCGNRRRPAYQDICDWVIRAIHDMKPETIMRSFTVTL